MKTLLSAANIHSVIVPLLVLVLAAAATCIAGVPITVLHIVTWFSAALAAYFFQACNRLLMPGARQLSYWFAVLLLVSAPVFGRSAVAALPDMTVLALLLGAFVYGFQYEGYQRPYSLVFAALLGGFAVLVRPLVAVMVLPLAVWLLWQMVQKRHWSHVWLPLLGVCWLFFWAKMPLGNMASSPLVMQDWSWVHWFKSPSATGHGEGHFTLPNVLFAISPLCHIGFFVLLPLVFIFFKKTDLYLPEKKLLLLCLIAYVLLIGGLPVQNIRDLLPVWALLLLLLFPALDRLVSYGLFYAKQAVWLFFAIALLVQWIGFWYAG